MLALILFPKAARHVSVRVQRDQLEPENKGKIQALQTPSNLWKYVSLFSFIKILLIFFWSLMICYLYRQTAINFVSLTADKYASTIVQRLRFGLQVMDTLKSLTHRIQWTVLSTLLSESDGHTKQLTSQNSMNCAEYIVIIKWWTVGHTKYLNL